MYYPGCITRGSICITQGSRLPGATLDGVAIPILAGDMDYAVLAARDQVGAEDVGADHGVAAGVIGDRQRVKGRVFGEPTGQAHDLAAVAFCDQPAGGHKLDDMDKFFAFF